MVGSVILFLAFLSLSGCGYILEQISQKSTSEPAGIRAKISLKDPLTSSMTETHQASVAVVIGDDDGVTKWCVSEGQVTAPLSSTAVCSGGIGASGGWSVTRPTSMTLSDPDGIKKVHLWVASSDGVVSSTSVSSEILLNRTPPTAILTSCPVSPSSTASLNVDVSGAGVADYIYKVGVAADCTSGSGYAVSFTSESTNITDALSSEGSYILCVRGQDAAENIQTSALATSCSWTRDVSGPTAPGTFVDGTWINQTDRTPTVTWAASTDTYSSVGSYEIAIGTSAGGTQTLTWTDVGNVLTYQKTGLSLVDGTTYYVSIRAKDILGNIGAVSQGDGFTVDASGPAAPGSLSDGIFWNSVVQTPTVTWVAAVTAGSAVASYEFAIGSTAGATNVLTWTNIGNVTSYQRTGLTLSNETRYYVSVRAIDAAGNTGAASDSDGWDARTNVVGSLQWVQQAYIKAANAEAGDWFGWQVAGSGDTLVVEALTEDSNQTTITNGTSASTNNASSNSGAVYVYKRNGTAWTQEAYIKTSNAESGDFIGQMEISGDTLVLASELDDSNLTTITNGASSSTDNSAQDSGAIFIYQRTGTTWAQQAYIKAVNADSFDSFGASVSISGDKIAVGAHQEDSTQITITNGAAASANNTGPNRGAVYIYKRTGTTWAQEAYIKAANAGNGDEFGWNVSISGDTLAVGARSEDSNQTTISNGTGASADNSATESGAVYVYRCTGTSWAQEAYVKAANAKQDDYFGFTGNTKSAVHLSGETLIVAAPFENSSQTTISNGATASSDVSAPNSGAIFVYKRSGINWAQEAYIKAPTTGLSLGQSSSISQDTIVGGAGEKAYVFKRTGSSWANEATLIAVNDDAAVDAFGASSAIWGNTIAVGAYLEGSNQTTITNGPTASSDNSAVGSGAVYVYVRQVVGDMNLDLANERLGIHQEAYIKAANAEADDRFGVNVAISGDTVVVGASNEDSNQTTITNGTAASSNNALSNSGAVYVYKRDGTTWAQEAYIKAVNADVDDFFSDVAIDGDTLLVGAFGEDSNQSTITNGPTASSNNAVNSTGAVYVYQRNGSTWAQQAYIKASNSGENDMFSKVGISGNGIIVGAFSEDSGQTTITNGATASADNSQDSSGAAYIFRRTGTSWAQEAYLKAPNPDSADLFGQNVAIDGDTAVVGASYEASNLTTITNGTTASADNSKMTSGAVYIYKRTGTTWAQEAFVKAVNTDTSTKFGDSVSISLDTVVIGATWEWSNQTTITNGPTASSNRTAPVAGAAYIYKRTGTTWVQEAYVKAANAETGDIFGTDVSIYGDTLIVTAKDEDSNQTTTTLGSAASSNNSLASSGAAYIFQRTGTSWAQKVYIKAANASANDYFGSSAGLWGDTAVVGAPFEDSTQTTITNGTTASIDDSAVDSGAVYIYRIQSP